jgi:hypothetical protein
VTDREEWCSFLLLIHVPWWKCIKSQPLDLLRNSLKVLCLCASMPVGFVLICKILCYDSTMIWVDNYPPRFLKLSCTTGRLLRRHCKGFVL